MEVDLDILDFCVDIVRHSLSINQFAWNMLIDGVTVPPLVGAEVRNSVKAWITPFMLPNSQIQLIISSSLDGIRNCCKYYFARCNAQATNPLYSGWSLIAFLLETRIRMAQTLRYCHWTNHFVTVVVLELACTLTNLHPWIHVNGGWLELKTHCDAHPLSD